MAFLRLFPQRYHNRLHAGKVLAQSLKRYAGRDDAIALALPRGGVPVGFALARDLGIAFDVLVVRKLGLPGHEEYAMGAAASGAVRVVNKGVLAAEGVSAGQFDAETARAAREIARRERAYRGERPPPSLEGRAVILVDDGLATGASMRAAVHSARKGGPARIVVAVPVGAPESCAALAAEVDELVCPNMPARFRAVSQWYEQFPQMTDEEVQDLLALAWRGAAPPAGAAGKAARTR